MRRFTFLSLLLATIQIYCQDQFSKQFSLNTDNDLYTSVNRDRYYTSGIFLSYKYAAKNLKNNEVNRIYEWHLGHEMFTPQKAIVASANEHDRPFAAYLYAGFGITRAYEDHILRTNFELGMIGPSARGREIQDFIHDIYGFRKAVGWQFQISDAIGINADALYVKELYTPEKKRFDISWMTDASLGTVYTNVATGLYSRIGFQPLQKINSSIAFNTHLNSQKQKRAMESFFFINPMLRYQLYDATVEGSLFNQSSSITYDVKPIVFHLQMGILFTAHRFNLGYVYHFITSTSEGLVHDHGNIYGSIQLGYLFD